VPDLKLVRARTDREAMDLDGLLRHAVDLGASDVHLKVGRPPTLRIDGCLAPIEGVPFLQPEALESVLQRICARAPARLERFLESGDLDIAYMTGSRLRFRVNAFCQRGDTSFAFRLIPRQIPTLSQLGLPPGVERLTREGHGLVVVTGPTGAGKSTTLAAMIDTINRARQAHIVTIEDPIEFLHDDRGSIVNQREVGLDTESFKHGLRQALRQDPDVILIGELRDTESAETALQASESGHLVLTSLHTIDAAETIGRIVELFPSAKQDQARTILAGVLRGVVSQRLLPRNEGGRVSAVEVMVVNTRIADLIRENRTDQIPEAIADGKFFQMQTFTEALVGLVVGGVVDRETAAHVAINRHDFLLEVDHALRTHDVNASADREPELDAPQLRTVS
jgi:twitching motility protein PilT